MVDGYKTFRTQSVISKLTIVKKLFKPTTPLLPNDFQVYLPFDSGYVSAKFIKWDCKRNSMSDVG